MSLTLGEKLRQAREERGISVSEVAEQTRISPHYLDCIENDDYRTLPGGIFNKGFVKSFAKSVGLDEQEALQDYSSLIASQEGDASEEPQTYRPEVLTDDRSISSMVPTIIFAVIILGLMTWGLLTLVNYIQNQPPSNSTNNPPANSANNANQTQANTNTNINQSSPSMNALKIEFKVSSGELSLTSVNDGNKANTIVTPAKPLTFEPKESLKLSFAKSLAPIAQLTINGKQITMPSEPENPKRVPIEFEINKDNIGQIWQNNAITFPNANTNSATR